MILERGDEQPDAQNSRDESQEFWDLGLQEEGFPAGSRGVMQTLGIPAGPPVLRRNLRYLGENLGVSLGELKPEDAAVIREAYQVLQELLQALKRCLSGGGPLGLLRHMREKELDEKLSELNRRLRAISWEGAGSAQEAVRVLRSVKDASGGAWASLLTAVDLVMLLNTEIQHSDVLRVFYLTRDQLKILRNCFPGLDAERARLDRELNFHSTKLLREKWEGFEVFGKVVRVHTEQDAAIACCCLEFSTLDRVLYQLIYFVGSQGEEQGELDFWIKRLEGVSGLDLLLVFEVGLRKEQVAALEELCGGWDLRGLFEGRVRMPEGLSSDGLQICLDCVCNAWGYESSREALDAGLIGCRVTGEEGERYVLRSWFFWPGMADTSTAPAREQTSLPV